MMESRYFLATSGAKHSYRATSLDPPLSRNDNSMNSYTTYNASFLPLRSERLPYPEFTTRELPISPPPPPNPPKPLAELKTHLRPSQYPCISQGDYHSYAKKPSFSFLETLYYQHARRQENKYDAAECTNSIKYRHPLTGQHALLYSSDEKPAYKESCALSTRGLRSYRYHFREGPYDSVNKGFNQRKLDRENQRLSHLLHFKDKEVALLRSQIENLKSEYSRISLNRTKQQVTESKGSSSTSSSWISSRCFRKVGFTPSGSSTANEESSSTTLPAPRPGMDANGNYLGATLAALNPLPKVLEHCKRISPKKVKWQNANLKNLPNSMEQLHSCGNLKDDSILQNIIIPVPSSSVCSSYDSLGSQRLVLSDLSKKNETVLSDDSATSRDVQEHAKSRRRVSMSSALITVSPPFEDEKCKGVVDLVATSKLDGLQEVHSSNMLLKYLESEYEKLVVPQHTNPLYNPNDLNLLHHELSGEGTVAHNANFENTPSLLSQHIRSGITNSLLDTTKDLAGQDPAFCKPELAIHTTSTKQVVPSASSPKIMIQVRPGRISFRTGLNTELSTDGNA